jgi:hypothetical protein
MKKLAGVFLFAILTAIGYYICSGLILPGPPKLEQAFVAIIVGSAFSILVDLGLIMMLFYTDQDGCDGTSVCRVNVRTHHQGASGRQTGNKT